MKRVLMFVGILAISAIVAKSFAAIVITGTGTIVVICLALGVGGIFDAIIYFAGGQSAIADKALEFFLGIKKEDKE